MSNKTYFITGGGTGGHIYPAVAIADELVKNGENIYYVGNPKNLEYDIISQKGYKFLPVNVHGMPRGAKISIIKWGLQLLWAIIKSFGYIIKYKPDAIIGTGGYVSAPSIIAAKLLGKPYMMHDCDAQPGLVTRYLAPYAKAVSVAFESANKFIKNKNFYVNGNPIRPQFKTLSKEEARNNMGLENKLTLCIMGGSQGARTINDASVSLLKKLSKEYNMQIIFQTGKKNYERVIEQIIRIYPEYELDKNLIIRPYFEDMVTALKASDIAISRAGSLSLSEIEAAGLASILVPYPHAAADHQRKNAKYMVEKGASLYLEDSETDELRLGELIEFLVNNPDKLHELQKNALALAKYDGVQKILEQLDKIS
ncbi:undecaprenyldiphospho-muramoylpentapeptide beta-N-acetylglucosaminyltransferase [bacterium]|nr:undecaprenyldiphospho-muramoylpentapeptide beta-N-acetylglucosaminyltransferase [bacterium]